MTSVKAFPKFECNIDSDIDFQRAISVSFTKNSRSFTELTDRLAFVNFSSLLQRIIWGLLVLGPMFSQWFHVLSGKFPEIHVFWKHLGIFIFSTRSHYLSPFQVILTGSVGVNISDGVC